MSVALIVAAILAVLDPGGAEPADTVLGGPPSITTSSSGTVSTDNVLGGPPSVAADNVLGGTPSK